MKDMLKDQVAIVTGGGSGMGEATAKLYAKEGAKVVIADFNEEKAKKVVDAITADGGVARFYKKMDVSDRAQVEEIAKLTYEEFGRIDILAAFAGGTFDGNPNLTQQQVLEKTTAVNQWGMFISSLTESQPLAAGGTFLVLLLNFFSSSLASYVSVGSGLLTSLCLFDRIDNFVYGILDLNSVIFYLSVIAFFVFLTIQACEKRRWS